MIGRRLLHYEVVEKLGEGGMGVVYKARDSHLDRFVAIKVLPAEKMSDLERKRRFAQEAKTASALNHPNIITIHDVAQADGLDFLVMEYVPGKTLDQLIPRRGMRLSEALRCAAEIADALAAAHRAGIVHRDLKPGNVMVGDSGRVKVLDFGLAKLTEPALPSEDAPTKTLAPHTREGAVVGTAAYMSPEQAQGVPVDARSDIFSFGSVLYEMVTGRRAFSGDSMVSTLAAVLNQEPTPLPADVPSELSRIIARCLRKAPARRFQHMDDVKVALDELKEESDSGKASAAEVPPRRRLRFLWAAGALVAAVMAVSAVAWWLRSKGPIRGPAPLNVVPLTAYRGTEMAPSFSPDGAQVAFMWNGENQDNWDIYVKVIGTEKPLRLTSDPANEAYPVWSPDGRWIAFARDLGNGRGGYFLIPPIGGLERKLAEEALLETSGGRTMGWSADGKWLVGARQDAPRKVSALFLFPVEGGEPRRLTSPPDGILGDITPAISPDGRTLVFARSVHSGAAADLYSLALSPELEPQGEPRRLTFSNAETNLGPAWTPDGRDIVYSWRTRNVWTLLRLTPGSSEPPQQLAFAGEGAGSPDLSRKGGRLAFARFAYDVDIWRASVSASGEAVGQPEKLISSTQWDRIPSYSPDGKKIAFGSARSGAQEIWVCDSDGANPVQLTTSSRSETPSWSPDGKQVAFASWTSGVQEVHVVPAEGGSSRRLTSGPGQKRFPTWSRDGQWVYFSKQTAGENQREIWKVPLSGGEAIRVGWNGNSVWESPDGQYAYFLRANILWKLPLKNGMPAGPEERVLDSVYGYQVTASGIYYTTAPGGSREVGVQYFDLRTRDARTVTTIQRPDYGFAASPDGRSILFAQRTEFVGDLMLVENFR